MRETVGNPGCDHDNVPPTPASSPRRQPSPPRSPPASPPPASSCPAPSPTGRTRCGHPGCRCHADPPRLHGPYWQWTRKKDGKTASRILTDDQLADYGPWFDNHRRLRELHHRLEALSLAIAEADPRWNRSHPRRGTAQPARRTGTQATR